MRRALRRRWWRRAAVTLGLGFALVLLAYPPAGAASDVWGNVGPASPLGSAGLFGRYPLSHYMLDQHFDAISASLTSVDASGVAPMIAYVLATVLWALTSFLANALITLFAFAFSLDLLNGSSATGGAGALAPVAEAIHSLYANVFGAPWLVLAVAVTGIWAMWKALVQRRYAETAGALGLSLIYVVVALFFVAEPAKTIGAASEWTNRMSVAFLAVSANGSASGGAQAREDAANQLFDLLIAKPWAVMEFGGLEHCALSGSGSEDADPESVAVRPLSSSPARDAELARRLQAGSEVSAEGKVCVNNANKYASHFLRFDLGSDERDDEYDALDHGDSSSVPDADPERRGYRLGVADKPATDAMEEGGQYQRLLIAIVVFCGELGAFCLLGALSVGVILAQVLLLLLLAFAPVALVAAAIPGRGHAFFRSWLEKLVGYLLRKAAYSLVLAILLAVCGALASATSGLGWLMSFGLQALFFWAVFLQRRALTEGLVGIATGPGAPGRETSLRLLGLYYGARAVNRPLRGVRRRAGAVGRAPGRLLGSAIGSRGDGAGPLGGRPRAPRFGTSYSRPVGAGAPPVESPAARERPASQGPGRGEEGGHSGTEAPKAGKPVAKGRGPRVRTAKAEARVGEGGTGRPPAAGEKRQETQAGEKPSRQPHPGRQVGKGRKAAEKRRSQARRDGEPVRQEPEHVEEQGLDAELRTERERIEEDPRKPGGEQSAGPAARPSRRPRRRRKGAGG